MTVSRRTVLAFGLAAFAPWDQALAESRRRYRGDPDEPYPIRTRGRGMVPSKFQRRWVRHDTGHPPGTILIDTGNKYLYLQRDRGRAWRYGIGVGRQGFSWKGAATIRRKAKWPDWWPPEAMRRRQPYLPRHVKGGLDNPLGARALYLFQGGRDTLYRIHGTTEPQSIGQAMSSGCVRMLNEDVVDLFERVPLGTRVIVI